MDSQSFNSTSSDELDDQLAASYIYDQMLDLEEKTQPSRKRIRHEDSNDSTEYVSKYFIKKRKVDNSESGNTSAQAIVESNVEVIELESDDIENVPALIDSSDDESNEDVDSSDMGCNSDIPLWKVTEVDSSDLDDVAELRSKLANLPSRNSGYAILYPLDEYYTYYVKRFIDHLSRCIISNEVLGCQSHRLRFLHKGRYLSRTLKLINGKRQKSICATTLAGVVKYHMSLPMGFEVSHLCGTGDCVRQSHIIFETSKSNNARRKCSAMCICICDKKPYCMFPHVSTLTGNEKLSDMKSLWRKLGSFRV